MAGTLFRVIPTDIKAFVIGTNGGNFDQDLFTNVGNYLEYYRDSQQGYSISTLVAYGYTSSYTSSGGSGSDVIFDIGFTPDPSVIPPVFNLYAWSNPNGLAPGDFVYTASIQPNVGDTVYNAAGTATNTIAYRTINSTTGKVTSITPTNAPLAWPRAKAVNDIIVLPEYLYAYTDPNASGETLYGWGESTGEYGTYTKSLTPVTGDDVFNRKGVKYTGSSVESVASDYSYIITGPAGPQYRNSSLDVIIYDIPPTLYIDSATLTTGMTLYDNTGTDTGYKVGEISGNSFDIQSTTYPEPNGYPVQQ